MPKTVSLIATMVLVLGMSSCGKDSGTSVTEDTSTSGSIASAVGGAYNGSSTSGTQAMLRLPPSKTDQLLASLNPIAKAYASSTCPTFSSTTLTSCLSSTQSVAYSDCVFGDSSATWNGSASLSCSGSFASPTIQRVITNGTTRTNAYGTVVTIKTSGISTFNGASISGSGTTVSPSSVTIGGIELTGSSNGTETYDHVITSSALSLSGQTVSGTVTTYHNLAKVIGTATVNLSFSSGCCTPTSGSISTHFQAYGSFGARSGFNGATETLTFNSCGSATYTGPEGYSGTVTLANCM